MKVAVSNQSLVFFSSVSSVRLLWGAYGTGLFRIVRKSVKTSRVDAFVEDSLFWAVATGATFALYFSQLGGNRSSSSSRRIGDYCIFRP
jgi:hypothetical protein